MMHSRNRAWRRHIEDKKIIKRLKLLEKTKNWWSLEDANNFYLRNEVNWFDLISTQSSNFAKNSSTPRYVSRFKNKWGKKGRRSYDWSFSPWTRHKFKERTRKELKYEFESNSIYTR